MLTSAGGALELSCVAGENAIEKLRDGVKGGLEDVLECHGLSRPIHIDGSSPSLRLVASENREPEEYSPSDGERMQWPVASV